MTAPRRRLLLAACLLSVAGLAGCEGERVKELEAQTKQLEATNDELRKANEDLRVEVAKLRERAAAQVAVRSLEEKREEKRAAAAKAAQPAQPAKPTADATQRLHQAATGGGSFK